MDINIYNDMAKRTGGEIFVGVVGPVRTGKSTFIKGVMEQIMLPNITDEFDAKRARDEMPQSAAGRTVMTAEPKFIPDEAVSVTLADGASFKMRIVDCVGFIVEGAGGLSEDGQPRMVKTPWSEQEMSFEEAAMIGTKKVIADHSTVAVLVTCDGSFGDIPRENYISAEELAVKELKAEGKPFCIIVNSADPSSCHHYLPILVLQELSVHRDRFTFRRTDSDRKYSCSHLGCLLCGCNRVILMVLAIRYDDYRTAFFALSTETSHRCIYRLAYGCSL
ncbi:MAG: hypothetical protein IIX09_05695, partial [Clostridia bacterium]|nr:hypothetical protein [Clostridia bacterium]